jgi:NifU-like protein
MVLDSVRPQLQRDHGDIELVDVDGKTIYVNMTGACAGCQMEALTLQGIQQKLMEDLGEFVKLVPTRAGALSRAASHA